MTRVDESAWVPKAKKRKAYRDQYREKFFGEVGLKKGAHVQDISGAPAEQQKLVRTLMELTMKGAIPDGPQKKHISAAMGTLTTVGLGFGDMGSVAANQDLLDRYSMKALRDNWFWSPAFFD
ncbi:hypothetical protein [Paracoccus onubensis]|uniref:Uncharacterized protein n=1 Tax=Paracoccus onubensis TaxID=1675788 RepID=A0A418T027_9RHOB|nr:hypothetical protein [Paracoccus onubensis]RJE86544.1 hypothetical protein D3P04_07450 [Paracoccus onubensis]